MGWGLGKNSPVVLSLGKANYEALIDRHGQWVRWRSARKCPCIPEGGEQPDIQCPRCGGTGDLYEYQRYAEDALRLTVRNRFLELPEEHGEAEVLLVYNAQGIEVGFLQTGRFVELLSGAALPLHNEVLEVRIRESLVKRLEQTDLEPIGKGWYRVPGVESPASKREGVYYRAPGDVLRVERVSAPAGEPVEVLDFRQNLLRLASDEARLCAWGVEWLPPFKFVILGQELNKADPPLVNAPTGEAVCTFPYTFEVAEHDCMTVLSGTMTAKALIPKGGGTEDVLPEFFAAQVNRLETAEQTYQEGVDFVLTGMNRLLWLGERRPPTGAFMSLVYQYYPTYRVVNSIPMLRTSEDQRIPRKVLLKLYSAFGEAKPVNRNGGTLL